METAPENNGQERKKEKNEYRQIAVDCQLETNYVCGGINLRLYLQCSMRP